MQEKEKEERGGKRDEDYRERHLEDDQLRENNNGEYECQGGGGTKDTSQEEGADENTTKRN